MTHIRLHQMMSRTEQAYGMDNIKINLSHMVVSWIVIDPACAENGQRLAQ